MALATGEAFARILGRGAEPELEGLNRFPFRTPTATPSLPGQPGGGAGTGVSTGQTFDPSTPSNPLPPPPTLPTNFQLGSNTPGVSPTGAGTFGGGADATGDFGVDEQFREFLRQRIQGEGVGPSFEDVVANRFLPQGELLDEQFERTQDQAFEDFINRGVLSSGEAERGVKDLARAQGLERASLLGNLASEFEQNRQQQINAAIQQFGILEGNLVQARTTISAANIDAAARIQSAAIGAKSNVQAAKISAQAALQMSGMDFQLAIQRLDQEMTLEGIDPFLFQNDADYRASVIDRQDLFQQAQNQLIIAETISRFVDLGLPIPPELQQA